MKDWLLINLFLMGLTGIIAGLLWLLAFAMNAIGLPPDDNKTLTAIGGIGCLFLTYYISRYIYRRLS